MRTVFFFALFVSSMMLVGCGNNRSLFPKSLLGKYRAEASSYEVTIDQKNVTVPHTTYELTLDYDKIWLTSPQQTFKLDFKVNAETKMYYNLLVSYDNGVAEVVEEWQLWKKGKRLIRKAIDSKPETIFVKK